jgi:hypothetical protein
MYDEDEPASISLQVAEIEERCFGYGFCSASNHVAHRLDIKPGEIVKVTGKKTTACIFYIKDDDEGLQLLRIDEWVRQNAGVNLGEIVKVIKIKPEPAKHVVIKTNINAPIVPRRILNSLMNRPMVNGDIISLKNMTFLDDRPNGESDNEILEKIFTNFGSDRDRTFMLGEMRFVVLETIPEDCIVKVTPMTKFEIKEGVWLDTDDKARDILMEIGSLEGLIEVRLEQIMNSQFNDAIDSLRGSFKRYMRKIEMKMKFLEIIHQSNDFHERNKPIITFIKQDLDTLKRLQNITELETIKEVTKESLEIHGKMNELASKLNLVAEE